MEKFKENNKELIIKILKVVGPILFFLGILGLIFPIIPGIPLLILSLIILGEESYLTRSFLKVLPRSLRVKVQKKLEKRKNKDG